MLPCLLNTVFNTNNAIHTHITHTKEALRNQFGNTAIMYRTLAKNNNKINRH